MKIGNPTTSENLPTRAEAKQKSHQPSLSDLFQMAESSEGDDLAALNDKARELLVKRLIDGMTTLQIKIDRHKKEKGDSSRIADAAYHSVQQVINRLSEIVDQKIRDTAGQSLKDLSYSELNQYQTILPFIPEDFADELVGLKEPVDKPVEPPVSYMGLFIRSCYSPESIYPEDSANPIDDAKCDLERIIGDISKDCLPDDTNIKLGVDIISHGQLKKILGRSSSKEDTQKAICIFAQMNIDPEESNSYIELPSPEGPTE